MKTKYDKDIIFFLEMNELSNIIKINKDVDEVIKDIEKNYKMGFSGIDWDQNNIIFSKKLNSDTLKYLEESKIFLDIVTQTFPNLLNEKVFVIGDNLTNLSYELDFKYFIKIADQILSIPQHTYIWFFDSKKCINFSFENEVFFG